MNIEQILQNCTVSGNQIKLPEGQLDRDIYMKVADKLKKIGGKWTGGKVQAFVFPHNPAELLAKISGGEAVNLKKDFQFFETPDVLAKRIVDLADINPTHRVLEPSAGYGAIVRQTPSSQVDCYEINGLCHDRLFALTNVVAVGDDFLAAPEHIKYQRIVANPPFSKNQDIDHIYKMYEVLADGGRMVSVASKHWQVSRGKKEEAFVLWLVSHGAVVYDIEPGTFKESGTNVGAVIIVLNKELKQ